MRDKVQNIIVVSPNQAKNAHHKLELAVRTFDVNLGNKKYTSAWKEYDESLAYNLNLLYRRIRINNRSKTKENDGYRLVSNSGINGRQEVPHFHVHILGGESLASNL